MKTLNEILQVQSYKYGFPIRRENGYGGEQDGSRPILHSFFVSSRNEAKQIYIPDCVQLHWAEYTAKMGWEICLGYWSNSPLTDADIELLEKLPKE